MNLNYYRLIEIIFLLPFPLNLIFTFFSFILFILPFIKNSIRTNIKTAFIHTLIINKNYFLEWFNIFFLYTSFLNSKILHSEFKIKMSTHFFNLIYVLWINQFCIQSFSFIKKKFILLFSEKFKSLFFDLQTFLNSIYKILNFLKLRFFYSLMIKLIIFLYSQLEI